MTWPNDTNLTQITENTEIGEMKLIIQNYKPNPGPRYLIEGLVSPLNFPLPHSFHYFLFISITESHLFPPPFLTFPMQPSVGVPKYPIFCYPSPSSWLAPT